MDNEIYDLLNTPIRETCRTKFVKICHLCDSMECCDNDNPLVKELKDLKARINIPNILYEMAGCCISNESALCASKKVVKMILQEKDK
jgi:hypothetical protein